jgi:hypothetical protein
MLHVPKVCRRDFVSKDDKQKGGTNQGELQQVEMPRQEERIRLVLQVAEGKRLPEQAEVERQQRLVLQVEQEKRPPQEEGQARKAKQDCEQSVSVQPSPFDEALLVAGIV